jgi:hypothetical protein
MYALLERTISFRVYTTEKPKLRGYGPEDGCDPWDPLRHRSVRASGGGVWMGASPTVDAIDGTRSRIDGGDGERTSSRESGTNGRRG